MRKTARGIDLSKTIGANLLATDTSAHHRLEEAREIEWLAQHNAFKRNFIERMADELASAVDALYYAKMSGDEKALSVAVDRVFAIARYEKLTFGNVFDTIFDQAIVKNNLIAEKKLGSNMEGR
jgi:hypothetical protein